MRNIHATETNSVGALNFIFNSMPSYPLPISMPIEIECDEYLKTMTVYRYMVVGCKLNPPLPSNEMDTYDIYDYDNATTKRSASHNNHFQQIHLVNKWNVLRMCLCASVCTFRREWDDANALRECE